MGQTCGPLILISDFSAFPHSHTHSSTSHNLYSHMHSSLCCFLRMHPGTAPPPPFHSSSHSLSTISVSPSALICAHLKTSSNFTVLKASVAWFWVLSGSGKCSYRHDMGKQRKKKRVAHMVRDTVRKQNTLYG